MTTLVTGATGFVGSAVLRALLADGVAVRALVRAGSDRRNLEGLDVELLEGDLRDPASLKRAVAGCAALYHVAADYRLWTVDPEAVYAANVAGSRALLLAAAEAGVDRIVYTSSVAALGHTADGSPADEDTLARESDMIGHYKRSKYLAEREVLRLVREDGLPAVVVNPSTPIGPRDVKPTPTGRIVVEALRGRVPAFVDTGLNVAHVDDVAAGHLLAFANGRIGERYVLGGEDLSLRAILAQIAALAGRRPPWVRLQHRLVLPLAHAAEALAGVTRREPFITVDGVRMAQRPMYFSSAKARRELGYAPRPATAALADAVAWFRAAGYAA